MPLTATRDHFMSRQLSREPVQVRHAREQARKALFKWSLGEHAELGELIVSELVTNALRHGEGKIQVRMPHADGDLRVAVHDSGAGRPVKHQPTVEGESGWGLAQLDGPDRAARWTARPPEQRFQGGKTVYAVIHLVPGTGGARRRTHQQRGGRHNGRAGRE